MQGESPCRIAVSENVSGSLFTSRHSMPSETIVAASACWPSGWQSYAVSQGCTPMLDAPARLHHAALDRFGSVLGELLAMKLLEDDAGRQLLRADRI